MDYIKALTDLQLSIGYVAGPVQPVNLRAVSKLLLNAWSAEYALRITPVVNDEQYLQSSLHWTFPQAYYSVLFSLRAFLFCQGFEASNEDKIRKAVAKRVVNGFYPNSVGFYAFGPVNSYQFGRISLSMLRVNVRPNDYECRNEIKEFLISTRNKRVKELKRSMQTNPKTALRSAKTGEISQIFTPEQYYQLTRNMGSTTYFDLLARLRISSTNREIERFIDSEIDVRAFHASLVNIVNHINGVHEIYIAKAIGIQAYSELFDGLPKYLREGFAGERLVNNILAVR